MICFSKNCKNVINRDNGIISESSLEFTLISYRKYSSPNIMLNTSNIINTVAIKASIGKIVFSRCVYSTISSLSFDKMGNEHPDPPMSNAAVLTLFCDSL